MSGRIAEMMDVAEEVERGSGPDENLDERVFSLVKGRQRYKSTFEQYDPSERLPEYTSSIDAARTFGGMCVFASDIGADGMAIVRLVVDTSSNPIVEYSGVATTLERAWLAASLRSCAALIQSGAA